MTNNDRLHELQSMPYEEYLQTPEWQERRQIMLERAGNCCQVCNGSSDLQVHHRTYERRGNEDMGSATTAGDLTPERAKEWYQEQIKLIQQEIQQAS
jgi:hypothetical protein